MSEWNVTKCIYSSTVITLLQRGILLCITAELDYNCNVPVNYKVPFRATLHLNYSITFQRKVQAERN